MEEAMWCGEEPQKTLSFHCVPTSPSATKLLLCVVPIRSSISAGIQPSDYVVPDEIKAAGFQICADELGSIVEGHDVKKLKFHGGVSGIAEKLSTSTTKGLNGNPELRRTRQELFGVNKFTESEVRSFWIFVFEAHQDMTLMILEVCAFVSLIVGIATEGWPKGAHDGLGIVGSILLVVFVTATSDYRQSLQFKDLDKEKKKISIQVTRNELHEIKSLLLMLSNIKCPSLETPHFMYMLIRPFPTKTLSSISLWSSLPRFNAANNSAQTDKTVEIVTQLTITQASCIRLKRLPLESKPLVTTLQLLTLGLTSG